MEQTLLTYGVPAVLAVAAAIVGHWYGSQKKKSSSAHAPTPSSVHPLLHAVSQALTSVSASLPAQVPATLPAAVLAHAESLVPALAHEILSKLFAEVQSGKPVSVDSVVAQILPNAAAVLSSAKK